MTASERFRGVCACVDLSAPTLPASNVYGDAMLLQGAAGPPALAEG